MKKILSIMMVLMMSWLPVQAQDHPYIVISGNDGNIIEAHDEHEVRSIASITKIMTAVVALEKGNYFDQWIIEDKDIEVDGSRIWIQAGQQVSMRSLLYGLMLKSGNDAAVAIARRVAGSTERFVDLMNKKAKQLQMENTTFNNPHGLDVQQEGNYSSAYDMAILMKYAMTLPLFRQLVATREYTSEWHSTWHNSNKLLNLFEFCNGGKTGYTSKAGRTLVTSSQRGKQSFIVVTLNRQERWDFHEQKHRKAMEECTLVCLQKKGKIIYRDREGMCDEPFEICLKKQDRTKGVYSIIPEGNHLILKWSDPSHTVIRVIETQQTGRHFCFWRWCI